MLLTAMTLNFQYGGRSDTRGRPENRWPALVDIVKKVSPDLLFGQEAHGWMTDPRLQAEAEDSLGMLAKVAPSKSGAHTVIMYRPEVLEWKHWETKYGFEESRHGFGVAVFDITADPKVTVPLTAISAHLHPSSLLRAAMEADVLVERIYRYGGMGIIGGDINYQGIDDDDPDWEKAAPYFRAARCHRRSGPDVPWLGNTLVAQTLSDGDLYDVANLIATRLDDPEADRELFAPTGHHGGIRNDQFWITDNMRDAVLGYCRVPTGDAGDHDAVVTTYETTALHDVEYLEWA
ncbi:hypothetical protein E1264_42550 [Actinomadura sp. KC216]|uniref:hypothetical protein n=1 Tax=Actinomadura sp. KC216 TaxID=2530370 RepID=UPI00104AA20E|nr:hypothetical protein [Actinomadura sp. KC216]TDB71212.1 hypothetical protein E1264_42550 [Actinomadura sp. KC216]